MLSRVLLWLGALLIVGGVLLLSLVVERHRYQRVLDAPPGPEWNATGERFIEPGTDIPVAVYCHRSSGERVYVRMQTPPPR